MVHYFIREKRDGVWTAWAEVDRAEWIKAGRRKGLRPTAREGFAGKDIEGRVTNDGSEPDKQKE